MRNDFFSCFPMNSFPFPSYFLVTRFQPPRALATSRARQQHPLTEEARALLGHRWQGPGSPPGWQVPGQAAQHPPLAAERARAILLHGSSVARGDPLPRELSRGMDPRATVGRGRAVSVVCSQRLQLLLQTPAEHRSFVGSLQPSGLQSSCGVRNPALLSQKKKKN